MKVFQKSARNGAWLVNSASTIDSTQFLDNTGTPSVRALQVQGGSPKIYSSQFKRNDYGVYLQDWTNPDSGDVVPATPDFGSPDQNTFEDNIVKDIFP